MLLEAIVVIISSAIPLSISFILAGLGEMFNQRAGTFNLGVEGIMLLGAFTGFFTVHHLNSDVLGLLAAMLVGGLMGLLMAVSVITFKATQGIAGIGMYMIGWGLSGTLFRIYVGGITSIEGITALHIPMLSDIPILGPILFQQNPLVYLTFLLVPIAWYVLFKTAWGLKVRAIGTMPRAADTLGINVEQIRYQCVILGGVMAGLAGAYLSICQAHMFADNITAGRGFIAVALVYFGKWHPVGIMGGALLFSLAHSLQRFIQVYGINFPYEIAVVFPYLLVIIVLGLSYKSKNLGPTALGKPYEREFRG
ncbi:ABC transporter permease [candidate division KSB3 bacterium]|uniref:ABC transporter permease n=1 Tax=candidate division KSB3 bacterium TaxID=2044937 RepID=A0A2G6KAI1_9BACT|nr:MAG: ABC transporter permease [candidate division KSB3 bacterium]